jgi:hypothetical protein
MSIRHLLRVRAVCSHSRSQILRRHSCGLHNKSWTTLTWQMMRCTLSATGLWMISGKRRPGLSFCTSAVRFAGYTTVLTNCCHFSPPCRRVYMPRGQPRPPLPYGACIRASSIGARRRTQVLRRVLPFPNARNIQLELSQLPSSTSRFGMVHPVYTGSGRLIHRVCNCTHCIHAPLVCRSTPITACRQTRSTNGL